LIPELIPITWPKALNGILSFWLYSYKKSYPIVLTQTTFARLLKRTVFPPLKPMPFVFCKFITLPAATPQFQNTSLFDLMFLVALIKISAPAFTY